MASVSEEVFDSKLLHKFEINRKREVNTFEPSHKKACLREFAINGPAQVLRLSGALKSANNKGADQNVQMRILICTFVVLIWHKAGFLMMRLIYITFTETKLHVYTPI